MSGQPGGSGSTRVAIGILASRIVGLFREVIIGVALGVGPVADAFRAAMRIPNLLQNLLGEGSISAAFVPVYARLVEDDADDEARTLAAQTLGALAATVTLLVALIVLGARPLVWATTLGGWTGPRYELAIELTRYTALGIGFLVLSAWCLGILNAHRRYLLSYSAPVLWSAAQIIALGIGLVVVDQSDPSGPATLARWGAIAMVIGSVGQLLVQVPMVRRVSGVRGPQRGVGDHLRAVLSRFGPAVAGRGVVQLSSYVDLALASLLAAGAIATLALVMPLYLLSISVFGFSVAVSELTEMSRTTAGMGAVAARVRAAQRRVMLPAGVLSAAALGGGSIVIGTLYEDLNQLLGGDDPATAFGSANTTVAAATLAAFALGLPATMVARVSQNALYALGDVRSPARIAAVRLVVAATVGLVLMLQLDHLAVGRLATLDQAAGRPVAADTDQESDAALRRQLETALGQSLDDGPGNTLAVGGFPHWPLTEPLPNRERLDSATGTDGRGTPFVHFGPVGLGLGSAVASWTEWYLLRRRLADRLGQSITTGLGPWVAIAGFAAFVMTRLVTALDLPSPLGLIVVAPAALGTYVGALWFMGLRPSTTRP